MKYLKYISFLTFIHNSYAVENTVTVIEYPGYRTSDTPISFQQNAPLLRFLKFENHPQNLEYFLEYKVTTFTQRSGNSFPGNAQIRENNGQFYKDWFGDIFYFEISPFVSFPTEVAYVTTRVDLIFKNGFD